MINGVTQLFMMKGDVLDQFDEIKICTHYKLKNGNITDTLPFDLCYKDYTPVYHSLEGWKTDISNISDFKSLPDKLIEYISFIENEVNIPINIVSVGPKRSQTLFKNNHFH